MIKNKDELRERITKAFLPYIIGTREGAGFKKGDLDDILDKILSAISKHQDKRWKEIERDFDRKFTRRSRNSDDKGKLMDRWFVRETTAEKLKSWLKEKLEI